MNKSRWGIAVLACLLATHVQAEAPTQPAAHEPVMASAAGAETIFAGGFERAPNILFVIMDDVGIDQMASFGYGGIDPPPMPSIDSIANGGLRFRNAWAMPECSPSRAVAFTGRYPLRHNINQAIGANDLANSHVSPYEVTVPKLLDTAGYESAMFGKFHLGGPENNPYGNGLAGALGFDRFEGWIGGLPESVDTTAGGIQDDGDGKGPYSCGFVPDTASDPVHGADEGACYTQTGTGGVACDFIDGNNAFGDSPGLQCLTRGGILVPNDTCQATPPSNLAWNRENAHYVSPMTRNHDGVVDEPDLLDPAGRGYRATIEVNTAIDWINARTGSDRPWMATVSFSNGHTPFQTPPRALLPSGAGAHLTADCLAPLNQRRLYDAMLEAMDTEFGRLLVETGLATANPSGGVTYDPAASNTVIVILGDNGSFSPTVKAPFDPERAKGSAYQTGVWVPLTVSGARVVAPGRNVEHGVNVADLYRLFGELAGVNVDAVVPRIVDGASMLPYLTSPAQPAIRTTNYTDGGLNLQANGVRNGPCVIGGQCTHTPMSKSICEDNGGKWWGVGADLTDPDILVGDLEHCWQVNQAIHHADEANYEANKLVMGAYTYRAVRNEHFKLVRNDWMDYDVDADDGVEIESEELYHVNQAMSPVLLKLDKEGTDVLEDGKLTAIEAINYVRLRDAFDAMLASKVACEGDGNDDGRVDQTDIDNYHAMTAGGYSGSSWYDVNLDGLTDAGDLAIIEARLGTTCWTVHP